ncbi:hypothetical protein OEZ85_008649 [Tetradesmus obliquus]|uniref:Uncharacterized protein n=2 Tax=Tetradesmus obliquus TaxID=3088 RepID=A0A383WAS4_TETOB|nr:hypothetical protein OEZ85_008649 [Tetradesmus obliquus]|eukprot:jgi/Sobl393_1/3266/SZX73786.1
MKLSGRVQRLAGVASKPLLPARAARRSCRVAAVLQEDPKLAAGGDQLLRARLEQLLPPSTRDNQGEAGYSDIAAKLPPRYLPEHKDAVWYLSYGANMSFDTLARRGVKVLQRAPCVLVDPNLKLVFQHRAGYSTLQPMAPGQLPKYKPFLPQVHGVLYLVNKEDMRKLQKREGGYNLTEVEVETYDGWRAKAQTFVSSSLALLHGEVTPTEKYMRVLREGAADNYLDPLYQAWLSSIDTVPSAGLPPAYFDTPAKYIAYCFLCIVGLVVVGFFSQQ